jgi:hypothetical protein
LKSLNRKLLSDGGIGEKGWGRERTREWRLIKIFFLIHGIMLVLKK